MKILLKLGLVLIAILFAISTVNSSTLDIRDSEGKPLERAVQGETLGVKIFQSGNTVSGVDVFFILNNGTPIHTRTDDNGETIFKPILTGTLRITAIKGENTSSIELPVITPQPAGGGDTGRTGRGGGGGGVVLSFPTPTPSPTSSPLKVTTLFTTPSETPETPEPTPVIYTSTPIESEEVKVEETPEVVQTIPTELIITVSVVIASIAVVLYAAMRK